MTPNLTTMRNAPMTALQHGMLYHSLGSEHDGVDTEHITMLLDEPIDPSRFIAVWNSVIATSDALRTSFRWQDIDEPARCIEPDFEMPCDVIDWSDRDVTDDDLIELQRADRARHFDLRQVPMRMTIVLMGNSRTWILWSFHHILLDGRSFPIVLRAVFGQYDRPTDQSTDPEWPSFDHYVSAQANVGATQLAGWQAQIAGHEAQPSLSVEPAQKIPTARYGAHERSLTLAQTAELRTEADRLGCSLNNLVQAAWAILLHRYLGQESVTFASTRACRHITDDAPGTVGLLINTVPFTVHVDRANSLAEFTGAVRDRHYGLRDLEATPLSLILQTAGLTRSSDLFESLVMYDDASLEHRLADLGGHRCFAYQGQTNFPLALLAYGDPEMLIRIEHDREQFSDAAAGRIVEQFCLVLRSFVNAADSLIGDLPYLTDLDHQLLRSYNKTERTYANDTLVDLLERQVSKTPEAVALRMASEELTYAEFNRRVNVVAHVLRQRGVTADTVVGVYARRSFELLIGIHAIVKAGGAYLPLDPDYPTDRLAFMIEDADCQLAVAGGHTATDAGRLNIGVLDLDDPTALPLHGNEKNPEPLVQAADAAYVLFTSGSTGRPKGVVNEHGGIVNRLHWMQETFGLTSDDVVLHKTPFTFDVSVWELFWPLHVGATLAIAAPDAHRDPRLLINEISASGVTTLHFVPSMLAHFVEDPAVDRCTTLERVICSGEALTRDLQDRAFSRIDAELHNLYGPTEAAIDVTWWRCDPTSNDTTVPIGFPIANTTMHVVDSALDLVPPGAQGELLIGGVQVARGYLRRPELTAERFLNANAIATDPGRTYRTGDLGRHRVDGSLEYLGRTDHQVKIRGQRIELGEIEACIMATPWVTNCVVVDREDQPGNRELAAYLEADPRSLMANAPDSEWQTQLRGRLGSALADYMIPASFTMLGTLPLSTAGKVDRSRLPAPRTAPRSTEAPAGETETRVAQAWAELLNYTEIDREVPFFQAGGHSLLIISLAQRLSIEFDREVTVTDLLDKATVAAQARFLGSDTRAQDKINLATTVAKRKQGSNRRRRGRVSTRRG